MLKKIISGGQTGADRAALDVARKFNIDHGGWIPKGRLTEDGPLPLTYQLDEMDTADYRERTKQNIIDSHGTVIISRGRLTGGSQLTRSFARVTGRPHCYLNLFTAEAFEAAVVLKSFILENTIQILNVAGPRQSHDPGIYMDVKTILEAVIYLLFLDTRQDEVLKEHIPSGHVTEEFPKTLESAVDLLCKDLPLKTRSYIARSGWNDIHMLYFTLMEYVRHRVGFDGNNQPLLTDCFLNLADNTPAVEDAVMVILKRCKRRLETDHLIRVVK